MNRRRFLATVFAASAAPSLARAQRPRPRKIVLRSSWQTVNIGDVAHTPGMLALLERHHPDAAVTLWPNTLSVEVERLLTARFSKLRIARTEAEQAAALEACDFFLHGSGPSLVGSLETERARKAGKPYGIAGVTLVDEQIQANRETLAGAKFIFARDTISLEALKKSGLTGPKMEFGPDATFALDLRDEGAAARLLAAHQLEAGQFLCAVPRLRWTPYWEIHPERVKPNPERIAINAKFAEADHAKQREAIIAWVRQTKLRVLIAPEMTYAVPRLGPLLFDPLPADVKPHVAVMDRYWLTAEAASVYAKAAAVLSFEMHSPIMAIAGGVPAIHMRQPTDTSKGQMWRDVGLGDWLFEIEGATGEQIAVRLLALHHNRQATGATVAKARAFTAARARAMMDAITEAAVTGGAVDR